MDEAHLFKEKKKGIEMHPRARFSDPAVAQTLLNHIGI
jgi:hypothetical protein